MSLKNLKIEHTQINIEDTQYFYDMNVFNECATTDKILLNLDSWKNVYPSLVNIPVNWDYSIQYGILFSKSADENIKNVKSY